MEKPTQDLLSAQVVQGYDQDNEKVDVQHYSSVTSSSSGTAELEFTLLSSDTDYSIFVSAESVVPYNPRLRVPNEDVEQKDVKTGMNLNLMNSEESILNSLKDNPELADAVSKHISSMKNKKQINSQGKGQGSDNNWSGSSKKRRVIKQ